MSIFIIPDVMTLLLLTLVMSGAYKGKERSTPIARLGISEHRPLRAARY